MNRRTFVKSLPALTVLASTTATFAQDTPKPTQDLKPITLPKPEMDGGKSVLAALKERKTTRNISAKELPPQVLSNLLWAAFGVNREKGSFGKPGRTAASASNSQEIDLYVALPGRRLSVRSGSSPVGTRSGGRLARSRGSRGSRVRSAEHLLCR